MNELTQIYRDPLFGIAILLGIIALVILGDYYRNYYRKKQRQKSLNTLVKSYEHNGLFDGISEFLKVSKDPIPTLVFLAKSYANGGDNQQAIKIYLTLIEQFDDMQKKIEILQELGILYLRAGFLQKAKEIFLEILNLNPRNLKILYKLIELYEILGDFQSAYDALECVEENIAEMTIEKKSKLKLAQDYFLAQLLFNSREENREEKLCDLMHKQPLLQKLILSHFKLHNPKLFWENLPSSGWENYIDLLWDFSPEQIPLSIIKHSPCIELYQAKGYYPAKECSNFHLETLRLFTSYSMQKATLSFSYTCPHCKGEFPFDTFRCSSCGELGVLHLNLKPQRVKSEKNYSLL